MRRDIGFYVEAKIEQVYDAYLKAATNKPFERSCKQEPFHTIAFGLNFSAKYNMNGGSCNIHFMPCGSGTAVNMRFSVAQLAGARYERYAQDLNNAMQAFLPVMIRQEKYNMDDFLNSANQVPPAKAAAPAAPVASIPAAAPAVARSAVAPAAATYCTGCGSQLAPGGRFCSQCGAAVSAPVQKCCPNCYTPAENNAFFCASCGTKL